MKYINYLLKMILLTFVFVFTSCDANIDEPDLVDIALEDAIDSDVTEIEYYEVDEIDLLINEAALLGLIMQERDHRAGGGYYVTKSTDWANYIFVFRNLDELIPFYDIVSHIEYIDRASEFVVDWYKKVFDFEFEPINHRIHQTELVRGTGFVAVAAVGTNEIIYGGLNAGFPYVSAHELAHMMDYIANGVAMFAPFSEGIAHLMEYYFDRDAMEGLEDISIHGIAHHGFATGYYIYVSDINPAFVPELPQYVPELSARVSATSFVQYLIETYGAEKYFQVHWRGAVGFDNIFGITLDEMIVQWQEFLEGYAAS